MKKNIAFAITLIRGILAVALGVGLLLSPEKALPILGNFMGMFWLASGVISLRWGAVGERPRRIAVLAGIIGSKERSSYALVGDTVNLASRIQGLTKNFACEVILSQTTHDLVTESYDMEQLSAIKVKGKKQDVMVYKLLR